VSHNYVDIVSRNYVDSTPVGEGSRNADGAQSAVHWARSGSQMSPARVREWALRGIANVSCDGPGCRTTLAGALRRQTTVSPTLSPGLTP
jgi:hypothetical protein